MRIHVYAAGGGQAQTQEVEPGARLGEIVELGDGEQLYRVDDADEDTEVDAGAAVGAVFGAGPGHLVRHTCRRVSVTVSYTGAEKVVEVRPSARLRRVRAKAIDLFGIGRADAADLVLRLPDSDQDLDLTLPVGAIVPAGSCSAALDLVHTVRPQG